MCSPTSKVVATISLFGKRPTETDTTFFTPSRTETALPDMYKVTWSAPASEVCICLVASFGAWTLAYFFSREPQAWVRIYHWWWFERRHVRIWWLSIPKRHGCCQGNLLAHPVRCREFKIEFAMARDPCPSFFVRRALFQPKRQLSVLALLFVRKV